jgi:aminoglycoside 3-N-acetyltransferase
MTTPLTQTDIVSAFRATGLGAGDVVLVHSAMRTVGKIADGARTVVDALLEVLGPTGTLVVPTFTFAHEAEDDPIIDPSTDRSEMGIITETARSRPDALRSVAYRHSFAALGPRGSVITDVDPSLSPFDLRASFGVMLALNTQVVLLGLTYSSSTSHHFAEFVCEVPYRQTLPLKVKVRRASGEVAEQAMTDYQPKSEGGSYYGSRGCDFNRLGKMLEDGDRVGTEFVGNSAARRFSMRDLVDLARVEAAKDHNVFRTADGQLETTTPLGFGQTVLSPTLIDGARRPHRVEWCVKESERLQMPPDEAS